MIRGSSARIALGCLSLALLALPLGLQRPGTLQSLKADEPAYFAMAMSLAKDGDLRYELADVRRLFEEFPNGPVQNLVLTSDDGWHTIHYGKPFVYSLFAAPFAALLGANGLLFLNLALLVAMIWMAAAYLGRPDELELAGLFAAAFFLLSVSWSYAFWLQPEVFNMAAVTAALWLGLGPADGRRDGARPGRRRGLQILSGAALALAVFNKPMLLALGLPVWVAAWRRPRSSGSRTAAAGQILSWLAGFAMVLGGLSAASLAMTGHGTPYLGGERAGITVLEPDSIPDLSGEAAEAPPAATAAATTSAPPARTWWWIFRRPTVPFSRLLENLGYFFVGRHTGLLLYMPFAIACLLAFLFERSKDWVRWSVLASLVAYGLFFQLFIPFNWHGGGGFVGNRYFANAYPAFLFLLVRPLPPGLLIGGVAWAGLVLGGLLVSPFGRAVPFPTLQAHVRSPVFQAFPLELSIRGVPGYLRTGTAGLNVLARRDQVVPEGEQYRLVGRAPVEIWLQSPEPIEDLVVEVASRTAGNRIEVRFGAAKESVVFGAGEAMERRLTLRPGTGKRRLDGERSVFAYRMVVQASSGSFEHWTVNYPPSRSKTFAQPSSSEEDLFVAARLTLLGTTRSLATDVFVVDWEPCGVPATLSPSQKLPLPIRFANRSPAVWPHEGAARVALSYHWKGTTTAGEVFEQWDGERTPLPSDIAAGSMVDLQATVVAPPQPGTYELALDLVREGVAWFSERGAATCRRPVKVEAEGS